MWTVMNTITQYKKTCQEKKYFPGRRGDSRIDDMVNNTDTRGAIPGGMDRGGSSVNSGATLSYIDTPEIKGLLPRQPPSKHNAGQSEASFLPGESPNPKKSPGQPSRVDVESHLERLDHPERGSQIGFEGFDLPSLVSICITQPNKSEIASKSLYLQNKGQNEGQKRCEDGVWLRGECSHKTERRINIPCKRRGCLVCGEKRKKRIAHRIEYGLEWLGAGAWFVGTFDYDISKDEAVKVQNKFIRWVRSTQKKRVEYVSTWENHRSGRLHLNLVFGGWGYVSQKKLSEKWQKFGGGKVVWIERIEAGIGVEVTKIRGKIGNYLAKFDQMVMSGRGVNYSKGWPKPPGREKIKRKGDIKWEYISNDDESYKDFENELALGWWVEVLPGTGEFKKRGDECCDCFKEVCNDARGSPECLKD